MPEPLQTPSPWPCLAKKPTTWKWLKYARYWGSVFFLSKGFKVFVNMHAKKFVMSNKEYTHTPYLLAWSCDRWWPDFVTFTACKRSIFGLKSGKMAQCVSNRCKDLLNRKKYFGVKRQIRNLSKVSYTMCIIFYFQMRFKLSLILNLLIPLIFLSCKVISSNFLKSKRKIKQLKENIC